MKKKSLLKIILIFLTGMLITGTAYSAWNIYRDIDNISLSESTISRSKQIQQATSSPCFSDTDKLDTSDWKVYRNEEYSFEVMYPENWSLNYRRKRAAQDAVITLTSPHTRDDIENALNHGLSWAPSADIRVYVYDHPGSLNKYFQDIQKRSGFNPVIEKKECFFRNYHAYKAIEGGHGKYFAIYIEEGNKIYNILFERRKNEESLSTIENEIAFNFKIIN